jgi:hypothetical protein
VCSKFQKHTRLKGKVKKRRYDQKRGRASDIYISIVEVYSLIKHVLKVSADIALGCMQYGVAVRECCLLVGALQTAQQWGRARGRTLSE